MQSLHERYCRSKSGAGRTNAQFSQPLLKSHRNPSRNGVQIFVLVQTGLFPVDEFAIVEIRIVIDRMFVATPEQARAYEKHAIHHRPSPFAHCQPGRFCYGFAVFCPKHRVAQITFILAVIEFDGSGNPVTPVVVLFWAASKSGSCCPSIPPASDRATLWPLSTIWFCYPTIYVKNNGYFLCRAGQSEPESQMHRVL